MDQGKYRKQAIQMNCYDCEYHIQDIKYVSQTTVKISCATTQFPAFTFFGLHVKTNGFRGLIKYYHLMLYPKLVNGKCSILWIPCSCVICTNMLYKLWSPGVAHVQKPHYQPVVGCTYWPVLGISNNWNIVQFTNKSSSDG